MLNDYQRGSIFGAVLAVTVFSFAISAHDQTQNGEGAKESAGVSQAHQEEKVFWADPINPLTLGLLLVGGIQAALFVWQLRLIQSGLTDAKEAADAARDSAIATKDAVDLASATAKHQLRAYVGVKRWQIESAAPVEPDGKHDTGEVVSTGAVFTDFLAVTMQNFGSTPATDVTFIGGVISINAFGKSLPPDFDFYKSNDLKASRPPNYFTSHFSLYPGETEISKVPITDSAALQNIKDARLQKASIFVWGRIYYRDIYERHWRTKACHAWEPWHSHGERFVPYSDHNGEDQVQIEQQTGA
jgi:hypothetical protein